MLYSTVGDSDLLLGSYGSLLLLQCVYNLGVTPLNLISSVCDFGKTYLFCSSCANRPDLGEKNTFGHSFSKSGTRPCSNMGKSTKFKVKRDLNFR